MTVASGATVTLGAASKPRFVGGGPDLTPTLIVSGTLTGTGTLDVYGAATNPPTLVGNGSISAPIQITGAAGTSALARGSLGPLRVQSSATLHPSGPLSVRGALTVDTGGILRSGVLTDTGTLRFDGSILTNSGSIALDTLQLGGTNQSFVGSGSLSLTNPIAIMPGAIFKLSGPLSLPRIEVNAGGTLDLNGQSLTLTGATPQLTLDGTLRGPGVVSTPTGSGTILNRSGTVEPGGSSPGILTLSAAYTQLAAAALSLDLAGTVAGSGHDLLDVAGAVSLDGSLFPNLRGTYTPVLSDTFTFLTANSFSGTFATILSPAGVGLTALYHPGDVALIAGDSGSVPVRAEQEPNSPLAQAQRIQLTANQAVYTGTLSSADDVDMFALNLPPGATITATLGGLSRDYDLGLIESLDSTTVLSDGVSLAHIWDARPDQPILANAIARQIAMTIDSAIRTRAPNVRNLVIVGADEIIPFYRTIDETTLGNERGYIGDLAADGAGLRNDSAMGGSLFFRGLKTDNFYADRVPTPWHGRQLYVPDLGIGRLVERPEEIVAYLNAYLSQPTATRQTIQAGTGGTALVTGYDFLSDLSTTAAGMFKGTGFTVTSMI